MIINLQEPSALYHAKINDVVALIHHLFQLTDPTFDSLVLYPAPFCILSADR
ncbi:hypothetical protein DsansV1_C14g0129871 [Dioscorea sansibarensis]